MTLVAKFTGSDSLGYKKGWIYTLQIADQNGFSICRVGGGGVCEYGSLSAFLNNWDSIHICKNNKQTYLK